MPSLCLQPWVLEPHDCITVSEVFCFGFILLALLKKFLVLIVARQKSWKLKPNVARGNYTDLHLRRSNKRWECRKEDCVQQTPFGLAEVLGDVLLVAVALWVWRGAHPWSGVATPPTALCSGSHHGALSSAQAGSLLNKTKPEDVLWSETSSAVAASGYSDRNHFVHEWATQQLGKFHTRKGPTPCRGRYPLVACCTRLVLGQSKSPLKCVRGGHRSTKGFALQICPSLSTAFAHVNATSDATSTLSWQVPTPPVPSFYLSRKPAEQIWGTQLCRRPEWHKTRQTKF